MTMTRATAHALAAAVLDRLVDQRPNLQLHAAARIAREALWNAFEDHQANTMVGTTAATAVKNALDDLEPPPWQVSDDAA